MKARLLGLLLLGAPASADPVPHTIQRHQRHVLSGHTRHSASQARPVPTGATDKPRVTTSSAQEESPAHRPSVEPVVAGRVFSTQISPDHALFRRSVVERASTWTGPVTRESSRWRPRIMLYPMKSMASGTGGKGVKLKFRI